MQLLAYTRKLALPRVSRIRIPEGGPTVSLSRAFDTPGVRADLVGDRLVETIYGPFPLDQAPTALEQLEHAPVIWQR